MANRKRPSDNAVGCLSPRKSARLATPRPGGDDSSGPSKTATPRPDGDDSSKTATPRPGGNDSSQKNSSQGKSLSGPELDQEVAKIVKNKDHAELMVLQLMRTYSFDHSRLRQLLGRKSTQPQSRLIDLHLTNFRYRKWSQCKLL
jgi:hypothetical protein